MADDTGNNGDPQAVPGAAIAQAGAGIATAAAGFAGVAQAVDSGSLTLSQDAAKALLGTIGQLRSQAKDLIGLADTIDKPLHFGHNWVGLTMDSRLRSVAAGQNTSIRPVLTEFANLLGEVEHTIARAAHLTVANDEDQRDLLTNAGDAS
ncbi:MAG TPA: hypothetical protein VGN81_20485 [Pseudonocardiaceae bacterium]